MNYDDGRWWLRLPPCPECGLPHVLINCRERLPFEVEPTLTGKDGGDE